MSREPHSRKSYKDYYDTVVRDRGEPGINRTALVFEVRKS